MESAWLFAGSLWIRRPAAIIGVCFALVRWLANDECPLVDWRMANVRWWRMANGEWRTPPADNTVGRLGICRCTGSCLRLAVLQAVALLSFME